MHLQVFGKELAVLQQVVLEKTTSRWFWKRLPAGSKPVYSYFLKKMYSFEGYVCKHFVQLVFKKVSNKGGCRLLVVTCCMRVLVGRLLVGSNACCTCSLFELEQ